MGVGVREARVDREGVVDAQLLRLGGARLIKIAEVVLNHGYGSGALRRDRYGTRGRIIGVAPHVDAQLGLVSGLFS